MNDILDIEWDFIEPHFGHILCVKDDMYMQLVLSFEALCDLTGKYRRYIERKEKVCLRDI